jgi:LytS/YehU family sensor histidine kinase
LSHLLRYTLAGSNAQEVPLSQELTFLGGYLEIQQIRFQGKLEVNQEIAPDVMDALVPNLILQPLVENAIKHGVSPSDGRGRIEVRAWRTGEALHLRVRDSGPGLQGVSGDGMPETGTGVGLRNTRERLESLYGSAQRFVLKDADGGGLQADITLRRWLWFRPSRRGRGASSPGFRGSDRPCSS